MDPTLLFPSGFLSIFLLLCLCLSVSLFTVLLTKERMGVGRRWSPAFCKFPGSWKRKGRIKPLWSVGVTLTHADLKVITTNGMRMIHVCQILNPFFNYSWKKQWIVKECGMTDYANMKRECDQRARCVLVTGRPDQSKPLMSGCPLVCPQLWCWTVVSALLSLWVHFKCFIMCVSLTGWFMITPLGYRLTI